MKNNYLVQIINLLLALSLHICYATYTTSIVFATDIPTKENAGQEKEIPSETVKEQQSLKIQIKPDKTLYQQGETSSVDVTVTDESGKPVVALLNIKIYHKKSDTMVSLTAKTDESGKFLMKDKWDNGLTGKFEFEIEASAETFKTIYGKSSFTIAEGILDIKIKSDKKNYLPGESSTVTVDVTTNNKPVNKALVIITITNKDLDITRTAKVLTDENGQVEWNQKWYHSLAGKWTIEITVSKKGFKSVSDNITINVPKKMLNMKIEPKSLVLLREEPLQLAINVTDETGSPVPATKLLLQYITKNKVEIEEEVMTNKMGIFTLKDASLKNTKGTWHISITAKKSGFKDLTQKATFKYSKYRISGRIIGPKGKPVTHTPVHYSSLDNSIAGTVKTSSNGRFEIGINQKAKYHIIATYPGYESLEKYDITPTVDLGEIQMKEEYIVIEGEKFYIRSEKELSKHIEEENTKLVHLKEEKVILKNKMDIWKNILKTRKNELKKYQDYFLQNPTKDKSIIQDVSITYSDKTLSEKTTSNTEHQTSESNNISPQTAITTMQEKDSHETFNAEYNHEQLITKRKAANKDVQIAKDKIETLKQKISLKQKEIDSQQKRIDILDKRINQLAGKEISK